MDGSTGAVPILYEEQEDHSICRSPIGLARGTYNFAEGHSWGFTFDGDRMQLFHVSDTGSETNLGVAEFKTGADLPRQHAGYKPVLFLKHKSTCQFSSARRTTTTWPMALPHTTPKVIGKSSTLTLDPPRRLAGRGRSHRCAIERFPPGLDISLNNTSVVA